MAPVHPRDKNSIHFPPIHSDLERQSLLPHASSATGYTLAPYSDAAPHALTATNPREPIKFSRECWISEIKCYSRHMVPPIILFVGVVGVIAWLIVTKMERKWEGGD